ncbi:phosphoenolpyruvate synthase [archaeon]|nr:phosphoenolpyruvate synthase [archaeon]MBT4241419.1 phosphoenolpyruvate synthase [archaeon]MBT4417710.1 phosphoenolpyruvate synthase [archaeon]
MAEGSNHDDNLGDFGAEDLVNGKEIESDKGDDNDSKQYHDKYIRWFSELNNQDIATVGGKGASLGEMFNNKFPVPPGFVVTAQSFEFFLKKGGLREKIKNIVEGIDLENTAELNKAVKEIRGLIESQEMPKELEDEILESYHILGSEKIDEKGVSSDALTILKNSQEPIFVSVRSSATTEDLVDASFAGQQESFLNIKGDRRIIEHVKKCFSSLYTARAIYYRNRKGFKEGEALLAVVIQKMVDSAKSGVVFSRDPVTLSEDVAMEAVFGLGEGIVSGKIKPDHYVATRDLKVKSVKVADKKIAVVRTSSGNNEIARLNPERSKSQVLTNGEILEVADYAVKLEDHYKKPQDIEFAIENRKVYILQSRPVTTLKEKKEEDEFEISGTAILEGQSASPGVGAGSVRIIKSMDDLDKIKKGDVLVTEMTNPDMVVAMQKSVAIVTNEGGMTSHAAIVSREMGIPAIVGTETATSVLKDGMKITVDGSSGKVYEGEVAKTEKVEILPVIKTDKISLKVIVDLPDFAERAALSKIEKVGLTRMEGIIASSGKHPLAFKKEDKLEEYSELLKKGIEKIANYFESVWIRSSDIRTDEYGSLEGAPEREINPMLGFHGIRFSLKHPEIFRAELEAIKMVAEKNPSKKFGIMFPQIISIEEVREAKKHFNEIKTDNMEFGVMIETPASVQIIDDICEEGVNFISFGTNDLTQFTLGVDRGNEDVQYLYNELHPAIFSQIEKVIDSCNKHNVETSICGQAGSKKEMVEFLVKKGIKSISVNADAGYEISKLIKEMESSIPEERGSEQGSEGVSNAEETSVIETLPTQEVEEESLESENNEEVRVGGEIGSNNLEVSVPEQSSEGDVEEPVIEKPIGLMNDKRGEVFVNNEDSENDLELKDSVDVEATLVNEEVGDMSDAEDDAEEILEDVVEEEKEEVNEPETRVEDEGISEYSDLEPSSESGTGSENSNFAEERESISEQSSEGRDDADDSSSVIEEEKEEPKKGRNYWKNKKRRERKRKWKERMEREKEEGISDSDKQLVNEDSNFLNKDKIQISAEREGVDASEYKEHIGAIAPMDNLDRIEGKAEELDEIVEEKKIDVDEEMDKIDDRTKVETILGEDVDERISSDEGISSDKSELGGDADSRESVIKGEHANNIIHEIKEIQNEMEKKGEKSYADQGLLEGEEKKESPELPTMESTSAELDNFESREESIPDSGESRDSNFADESVSEGESLDSEGSDKGSESLDSEGGAEEVDMGVYNPDNPEEEKKSEYNYFDDDY